MSNSKYVLHMNPRLACGAGLQPAVAGGDRVAVRQPDQRRPLARRGVRCGRVELRRGGRGAVGDGRAVSGARAGVGDFLYLQHRLRVVGEYHAAVVDCVDADESVDLRGVLRGDGGGGGGVCGVVWQAPSVGRGYKKRLGPSIDGYLSALLYSRPLPTGVINP